MRLTSLYLFLCLGLTSLITACGDHSGGGNSDSPAPTTTIADADNDSVPDADDQCAVTPSDETANADGCSPSQLDDDNDNVSNADDQCANTPTSETADANGCSPSQLDSDNDGVDDATDECPNTPANTNVASNGCPVTASDDDQDGVDNANDQCPNTPMNEAADTDGCSASQRDTDGDGVNDDQDQCPNTPSGDTVDSTGCSVTQAADTDNDGVNDANDQCPNTPTNEQADEDGCSISQRDTDGDGVNDDVDECALTPQSDIDDGTVDADGCGASQKDDDMDTVTNADDVCPGTPNNVEVEPTGEARAGCHPQHTRYQFNNQCFALQSVENNQYVVAAGPGYTATEADLANAEPFYMKPSALGKYLYYNSNEQLMTAVLTQITNQPLANAADDSEWNIVGATDTTDYPVAPQYNVEPSPRTITDFLEFDDPNVLDETFFIQSATLGANLAVNPTGTLELATPTNSPESQQFRIVETDTCAIFPEAQSNVAGESLTTLTPSFSGTVIDENGNDTGRVLGHADVHVHISATTFLGGAHWGTPFHKFGVTHALDDCTELHGANGERDVVGGAFGLDPANGADSFEHATDGWPTFTDWPARDQLTHEAIYWKWLERMWQSGLRVAVNDLVDNETLCELQRQVTGDPTIVCDSMANAGQQAGTMYAMQDYIDAQYGGRGEGWFQMVLTPERAREVIEEGKLAVVLGIEISNLLDCQITYNNPARTQQPFEETGDPLDGGVTYGCSMEESDPPQPNEILGQMQDLYALGVRQIVSIHEFDNAFGGNGIFDGSVLNLGNRENSGGNPSTPNPDDPFAGNPMPETPSGEFWTTYECPKEGETGTNGEPFSGYLWANQGGSSQSFLTAPTECFFSGQARDGDFRPGGSVPCYSAERQCNARWMTPTGKYFYEKLMTMGFIFDFDHMEMEMKSQALEMAEAQDPVYPLVSTHGTFGGTSIDQAKRTLLGGGHLYPSNGSSAGFIRDMTETLTVYNDAFTEAGIGPEDRPLFGFGYGTDTNGLSAQTNKRSNIQPGNEIVYPYALFSGPGFDDLPEFDNIPGLNFEQPSVATPDGTVHRTWHQDEDGHAHHGMSSSFVEEIRLDGTPENLRHLFNSAEVYLQTWEKTEAAKRGIAENGFQQPSYGPATPNTDQECLLRGAPSPNNPGSYCP